MRRTAADTARAWGHLDRTPLTPLADGLCEAYAWVEGRALQLAQEGSR